VIKKERMRLLNNANNPKCRKMAFELLYFFSFEEKVRMR